MYVHSVESLPLHFRILTCRQTLQTPPFSEAVEDEENESVEEQGEGRGERHRRRGERGEEREMMVYQVGGREVGDGCGGVPCGGRVGNHERKFLLLQ